MRENKRIIVILMVFTFAIAGCLIFRGMRKELSSEATSGIALEDVKDYMESPSENVTGGALKVEREADLSTKEVVTSLPKEEKKKLQSKSSKNPPTETDIPSHKVSKDGFAKQSKSKEKSKMKDKKKTRSFGSEKQEGTYRPTAMPVSTPESTMDTKKSCDLVISCAKILQNMEQMNTEKKSLIPSDGILLDLKEVSFEEGETVYHILLRICKERGIPIDMEGMWTGYIKGIGNIYEKDCGAESGWIYGVNKKFPNLGIKGYKVSAGDRIEILYTCKKGDYLNG